MKVQDQLHFLFTITAVLANTATVTYISPPNYKIGTRYTFLKGGKRELENCIQI